MVIPGDWDPILIPNRTYWFPDAIHLVTMCMNMDALKDAIESFEEEGKYPDAKEPDGVRSIVEPEQPYPNEVVLGAPHFFPLSPSLQFLFSHLENENIRLWVGISLRSEFRDEEYFPPIVFSEKGMSQDVNACVPGLPYGVDWKLNPSEGRLETSNYSLYQAIIDKHELDSLLIKEFQPAQSVMQFIMAYGLENPGLSDINFLTKWTPLPRKHTPLDLEAARKEIDWSEMKYDFVYVFDPKQNKMEIIKRPLNIADQNALGRPKLDLEFLRKELSELSANGGVKNYRGWRTKISERLLQRYIEEFSPDQPPQAKTIRKHLKPEFDALKPNLQKS